MNPTPNQTCGCCEGLEKVTPQAVLNRPGLDALAYRVGTHATFLETMLARLSSSEFPELANLTTRAPGDPAVALIDSWATVADVLAFYQERLANEGYLRTATERRSVLELARLVGYAPRPGLASTVFLAYTIDEDRSFTPPKGMSTILPAGRCAQSVPGPDELPQSFETSEELQARSEWNKFKPRMSQPQSKTSILENGLYLKGISTNLKPNDVLLMDFEGSSKKPQLMRVVEVIPDAAADRSKVRIRPFATSAPDPLSVKFTPLNVSKLLDDLQKPVSRPPANALQLRRKVNTLAASGSDFAPHLLTALQPSWGAALFPALGRAAVTPEPAIKVYAFRVKASLFGHNAPQKPIKLDDATKVMQMEEWPAGDMVKAEELTPPPPFPPPLTEATSSVLFLDAGYEKIPPKSWILVDSSAVALDEKALFHPIESDPPGLIVAKVGNHQADISRSAYGISGKTTRIELVEPLGTSSPKPWVKVTIPPAQINIAMVVPPPLGNDFQIIRRTVVYAQSEELALSEAPISEPLCDGAADPIELDSLYEGLPVGRWLILSGERTGVQGTSGVKASELVMLANVEHRFNSSLPGDKTHTFLTLSTKLAYCYERNTVAIYGNVVKATHGETRKEVLGSGDASKPLLSFPLRQPPLTYLPAPTAVGAASTLTVRVNEVEWHEIDTLAGLTPTDRSFITQTDDDGKTKIIFGNGREGARPPTGAENIAAVYRNGLGRPGNVKAEQISLLVSRPLGVKDVINPLPASGGADKETRDQVRENAPLAVLALDRLVSVQDYADFTRTFAGIGKANAARLSDGQRQLVHVTIAGADDIPIEEHSDLYRNLTQALHELGEPHLPIEVKSRELLLLIISAKVRVLPDYAWEFLAPKIREALLGTFSFGRRALAQDVTPSEVINAIQSVRGVAYVDLDFLHGVTEAKAKELLVKPPDKTPVTLEALAELLANDGSPATGVKALPVARVVAELARPSGPTSPVHSILPAQLAMLSPEVPETLILQEIPS